MSQVNQNYLHELNVCRKILEREQSQLHTDRTQIKYFEQMLRLDLERIQLLKRRIYELESHGNDRSNPAPLES